LGNIKFLTTPNIANKGKFPYKKLYQTIVVQAALLRFGGKWRPPSLKIPANNQSVDRQVNSNADYWPMRLLREGNLCCHLQTGPIT